MQTTTNRGHKVMTWTFGQDELKLVWGFNKTKITVTFNGIKKYIIQRYSI